MALFGGIQAMIESPLIQELLAETVAATRAQTRAETQRKAILRVLSSRFGSIPPDIVTALRPIQEEAKLNDLIDCATNCPNLEAFRARLA
jgi:hypothetical protein